MTALLGATLAGAAEPLFFVDSPFDPPETSTIYVVDPDSGAMTVRAELGSEFAPILALAAADGTTLYAAGTDNAGTVCAGSGFACLLLRIVLDPSSTAPASVEVVGALRSEGVPVAGVIGMTFRNDGALYMTSQDTFGLYTVDPASAEATLAGISSMELYGGDLTFDAEDRLLVWTNDMGFGAGLFEMDPATAATTLIDPEPHALFSGLAALGHSNVLYATSPWDDRLHTIDPVVGFTGASVPLAIDGAPFDHKRGDLDSPRCVDVSSCDDGDPCTLDSCTAGGCRHLLEDATCDGLDDDCDGLVDEDYAARPTACGVGACAREGATSCVDGTVVDDCAAGAPAGDDSVCNGVDDDCDGDVDEDHVAQATSCGAGACARTGAASCVGGALVDDCAPGSPASDDSVCNGIDDDCDGRVDEDADLDADGVPDCVDDCPSTGNAAQADGDGDGLGDACDCAPTDPANSAAIEVGNTVELSKSGAATIGWSDEGVAGPFRVYRGFRSPGRSWDYNQTCLGPSLTGTTTQDETTPRPGTVFFYVVTREGCSESIAARDSSGTPIPNDDPCPSSGQDADADGTPEAADDCPGLANPGQEDGDGDGHGDACDNCPSLSNPDQADTDQNGVGDACEAR